ncbi:MAG: glycosyltransferase [Verrucomicrobiia bacterium]|jgi:hypothetical protein
MGLEKLNIAISIADYCFERTRTIGQMNFAIGLIKALACSNYIDRLVVLKNRTIKFDFEKQNICFIDCDEAIRSKFSRIFWDQIGLYRIIKKTGVQWMFLPKGFSSFLLKPPALLAAYIHDAVPDYYRMRYPEGYNHLEQIYFNTAMKASLKYSKVIFTNSEFVVGEAKRLCKKWAIKREIPMYSIGVGFEKPASILEKKNGRLFVLVSRWQHKRSDLAIEYLKRWQEETGFNGGIDFVGDLPKNVSLPDMDGWRHYQRLPEDQYRRIFCNSSAVIYFSEYEGFGMPPVEAAINGVCPVYSDIPALREVMAGCGYAFDNNRYEDFSRAMKEALNTDFEKIKLWGEKLLSLHSWTTKVEKIVRALNEHR